MIGPELVRLDRRWRRAFLEMAAEQQAAGETRYDEALSDFDGHLAVLEAHARGEGLGAGRVPYEVHLLVDEGEVLGVARLRFGLTEELLDEGGNVGYEIRPSRRGQGHGRTLLRLALEVMAERGMWRARVTCDDDNAASAAIIEGARGVLDEVGISTESGKPVRRYWVKTTP
ncbi:MAG: GNAT family N-acetyltransferase [Acidobacteriota bacterium]